MTTSAKRAQPPMTIPLVRGVFDVADAHHLLLSLVNYKIGFHELKQFSEMERLGRLDKHSAKRIRELTAARRRLLRLLKRAAQHGDALRIDAGLSIRSAVTRRQRGTEKRHPAP